MAPSRKKGANKAAAAAAARRKWKTGDLVLAKVKGFPAWPATVSDPEKWGYRADQKKVVVQFFGSEQIAFCNPADIEEFTEEKKVSLLGKRHGKGADFVRAVNEIIDCFEKLKQQDQVSRVNGTVETGNSEENNSQESLTVFTKDEAPAATVDSISIGTPNDLNSLTEAAATEDALHNEDMQMQVGEKHSNVVLAKTSVSATHLTRSKIVKSRSQNSDKHSQGRKPARRLRSSARRDPSKLQSTVMTSNNSNGTSRRLRATASEDRSLRRSRRIIKSSDDSEGQDVESLALIANDRIKESDSGMMSVDSDTLSINDGSTADSVCNLGVSERPLSENNEGQMELSDRLDFQSNNVIKKKRKPNRKRHNNGTVDAAKPEIVASDAEGHGTECVLPSLTEKPAQTHATDDGDEHLPLVKRARVRMGRPLPAVEEELTLVHKEEITPKVPESHSVQSFEPLSCNVDASANKDSDPLKEEPALTSLPHVSPANKPNFWETRKKLVDVEAALPPSKRLHRALEAMSANVAEDCHRDSDCSRAANIQSNGFCNSASMECSEMSARKKTVTESDSGAADDLNNGDSLLIASDLFVAPNVESSENGVEAIAVISDCAKIVGTDGKIPELCTDSSDQGEGADSNSMKMTPFVEVPAEIDVIPEDHLKLDSVNVGEHLANLNFSTPADHCKTRFTELNEVAKGSDPDNLQKHSDSTFLLDIPGSSANPDTCNQLKSVSGAADEAHRTNDLLSAENNQDSKMSELVGEPRPASLNPNIMHPVTPVKGLNSGHHQSLAHSISVSYNNMEDRTVSIIQSSSSLTNGPDSVPRASPPNSSVCNTSALDNIKSLENNISSCPDVKLHLDKAKLAGKSSSIGEALPSFEATIKSLTRTKESIGRATRIAIDCAKFGFATKVVEILTHNLENESNLHKKVDLFFLVDSITQCSRGMKGDGGVYPSAIQALLPRLLLAAAPPSSSTHENHRQCLKVLRVWQERKIIPEPIIRHHIRELDALCGSYPTMSSNRSLRNERAIDDPIREMEGMQVDEYGSNSSIQLPGFCMPPMLRDDDVISDSDGESFEAVTPEHNNVDKLDGDRTVTPAVEKRRHILEDVDGELEMEDVAPCCGDDITSASDFPRVDQTQMSHQHSDNSNGDIPMTSGSLSRSPLPPLLLPPHPLLPTDFPPVERNSASDGSDTKPYSTSQNFNGNLQEPVLQRVKPSNVNGAHNVRKNNDSEIPRHVPDSSSACFSGRSNSRFSGRASNNDQPNDAHSKSFHLRPPHPAPSNQFSYVQERVQSRRDIPLPSRPNRFHSRNSDDGNFYRDRDRHKFVLRDNIGEGWRPPFPSISGPCYPDGSRMANTPMSYSGPPREPPLPHNRWNFPSRPMNHRHFNPYRPPSEGPIPVANRGPNYWRPRG